MLNTLKEYWSVGGKRRTSVVAAVAIFGFVAAGCPRTPEPEPPPLLLQVPKAYWAEADGTIGLGDDISVPGRVRLDYLVYPDDRVVIPNLVVWMDDVDIVVTFLFWEVDREELRCTVFRNDGPVAASLDNGEIVVPAGAKVLGRTFTKRNADDTCGGEPRRLDTASNAEMRVVHDPDANRFDVSASFVGVYQDNEVPVSLNADGRFLNRPPVAKLSFEGENVKTAANGCPGDEKGIATANTAEGLSVTLRSRSYDPDGKFPEGSNPKRPRVDLKDEQWARSQPGGFKYLGDGAEIGPVLFETGREHQLLLWATDRQGAEGRALCHFQVDPPS